MSYTGRDIDEAKECLESAGIDTCDFQESISAVAEKIAGFRELREAVWKFLDSCCNSCDIRELGEIYERNHKLKIGTEISSEERVPFHESRDERRKAMFAYLAAEADNFAELTGNSDLVFGLPLTQKEIEKMCDEDDMEVFGRQRIPHPRNMTLEEGAFI